jgi:hypothetical protein
VRRYAPRYTASIFLPSKALSSVLTHHPLPLSVSVLAPIHPSVRSSRCFFRAEKKREKMMMHTFHKPAVKKLAEEEPAAEKTTAGKKPKAEKRVPAGKSAGKEDGEGKRGRKKGKKSVETSHPHLSSSSRHSVEVEGVEQFGGRSWGIAGRAVQLWRSWREGVGSPGDDGTWGWASWRAGVGCPSDDGAPRWSGGGRRAGWACGGGRRAGWACGGGRRVGVGRPSDDGALGWSGGGRRAGWACGGRRRAGVGFSGPQADGPPRKSVIRVGNLKIVPHCLLNYAHTCL